MTDQIDAQADLERSHQLLARSRVHVELVDATLPTPLETVGAIAGYGLKSPKLDVVAGLYVLRSQSAAESARALLESANPARSGERVVTARNGRMTFLVRAHIEGPRGGPSHDALSNMVSAFAGDE